MTSFPIHVREKKVCLPAGHGPTEPATFNAWSKKENTCASFLQFEQPAAPTSVAHQSPSPCTHLHFFQPLLPTGSSLFCRGGEREWRQSSAGATKRQNCCLPAEGAEVE